MPDWVFTVLWVGIILYFVIVEGIALVRKRRGDTLSEHVWDWFCLRGKKEGKSGWCIVRRILFFAFWIWLTVHFLSGGAWL